MLFKKIRHYKLPKAIRIRKVFTKKVVFSLIALILLLVEIYFIYTDYRDTVYLPDYLNGSKVILLYTKFFNSKSWSNSIEKANSVCNCYFTNDLSQLSLADGVVFHWRAIKYVPQKAKKDQKFIWYLQEPPKFTYQEDYLRQTGSQFDCTGSHRKDSDIYLPYGHVEKVNQTLNYTAIKARCQRKMISWLVSDCKTQSEREDYVQQLQKFVNVDIYGYCGSLSCDNLQIPCHDYLRENYLFYLAFENSICKDYVTEKFFRTLQLDLIPVVMGAANYSTDYPPNSFIDALKFSSPQQLAEYLYQVANNETLYRQYFYWKKDYRIVQATLHNDLCQICQFISSNKSCTSLSNRHLYDWWFEDANCINWEQSLKRNHY